MSDLNVIFNEINKVIIGKSEVVEQIFMAMLTGGHILLDDVPGVGKTTMAVAISNVLGLNYRRIQFTPDVLPSDITGFSIYNKQTGAFEYMPGVIIDANMLLGDEINRTSSKTQSALLEAMEEGQVTVDGISHQLKKPFIVIATQNNVGTAGTQPLPYAQLDRFLIRLTIGYPNFEDQMAIMRDRQTVNPLDSVRRIIDIDDLTQMQQDVINITVKDSILEYITRLTIATREHSMIELGVSPRGAISINKMAKAHAYIKGRDYVIPDDVYAVFHNVCVHRIILNQKAKLEKATVSQILDIILKDVKIPDSLKIKRNK
jgi:MoxR-like ATPases